VRDEKFSRCLQIAKITAAAKQDNYLRCGLGEAFHEQIFTVIKVAVKCHASREPLGFIHKRASGRTVALKESRAGTGSARARGNWRRIHANEKCERVYAAV
jgi:hypothetical protein